jgi:UDP-N-acetylmuramoyl-tripeptide--D-alanyl-D-alanine ligase
MTLDMFKILDLPQICPHLRFNGYFFKGDNSLSISIDTRTMERGQVFMALKGPVWDGHDFIDDALLLGASGLIVLSSWQGDSSVPTFYCEDPLHSLQEMARHFRDIFEGPVVAITGSNGKTTTKDMVTHVLRKHGCSVVATEGNQNNQIGVSLTLLRLTPDIDCAVLELGTNHKGEINALGALVKPTLACITQITEAHLEGLGSLEGVCEEKVSLLTHLVKEKILVFPESDPYLLQVAEKFDGDKRPVFCDTKHLPKGNLVIPDHMTLNICLSLEIASCLGFKKDLSQVFLQDFSGAEGRFMVHQWSRIVCVDDSYNANPTSFHLGLKSLQKWTHERLLLVLGDMEELGIHAKRLHQKLAQDILEVKAGSVSWIGNWGDVVKEELELKKDFKGPWFSFKDVEAFKDNCPWTLKSGDLIYLKGSRTQHLDQLVSFFKKLRES